MLLNTRHFGEIEIDEENIILFEEGLPGFNHVRKFIILDKSGGKDTHGTNDIAEPVSPFEWFQCVDEPTLAFVIVNPFVFKPDYDIELSNEIIEHLEIEKEEDVALYSIVVVPEDMTKMTIMSQKAGQEV